MLADFNTRLDGDRGDLLHNIRGGVQVDQALVDAHLPAVPGVGACMARSNPTPHEGFAVPPEERLSTT